MFYEKYLYLKNKYNEQKNILMGGAFAFSNTGYLYIMLKINDTIETRINFRRTSLRLTPKNDFHITLLEFQINLDNNDSSIFESPEFREVVLASIQTNLLYKGILFNSDDNYHFLGRNNQFLVKEYILQEQSNHISKFRIDIYNYLNRSLGYFGRLSLKKEFRGNGDDIEEFNIYSNINNSIENELYAVSVSKYVGVQTWIPHISILSTKELNSELQRQLDAMEFDLEKISF